MPEFVDLQAFHLPGPYTPWGPVTGSSLPSSLREEQGVTPKRILFDGPGGRGEIQSVSPRCLRLRITRHPEFLPDRPSFRPDAVRPPDFPQAPGLHTEETEESLSAGTGEIRMVLQKNPLAVSLADGNGTLLTRGLPLLTAGRGSGAGQAGLIDRKAAPAGEEYYGLGERLSPLSRRWTKTDHWNSDQTEYHNETTERMYASFPVLLGWTPGTSRWWGLFLDNPYRSRFDLASNQPGELQFALTGGDYRAYWFTGTSPSEILREYTRITGRPERPPLWALGYHQCRHSYWTAGEAAAAAASLREKQIPCDGIWYDIGHMEEYRVFTFSRRDYPDPEAHLAEMHRQGFHTVAIVDPGVKIDPPGTNPVLDTGEENQYFIQDIRGKDYQGPVWPGGVKFPDFSQAEVRRWWGDLHGEYLRRGIDGIWNDMNEPAVLDTLQTVPLEYRMYDHGRYSGQDRMHNLYALLENQAAHEGLTRLRPNRRPFLLTRSGWPGIQRYAALWTGDNHATWDHLRRSIPQLLNLGLSGAGFCGADTGGFSGNTNPELLIRWTQLASCYPFFRNHTSDDTISQEPWSFGTEAEAACRRAVEERYRLLPYWLQLFLEMSETGAPPLRPLFWDYPSPEAARVEDQFLIGPDLMAAPVTEKGQRCRAVFLPPGGWYEQATGRFLSGGTEGRTVLAEAPLETLPLYVRAGALLPVLPRIPQHTGEISPEEMGLHIYLPQDGQAFPLSGTYREDPGEGKEYRRNTEPAISWTIPRRGRLLTAPENGSRIRKITATWHAPDAAPWTSRQMPGEPTPETKDSP